MRPLGVAVIGLDFASHAARHVMSAALLSANARADLVFRDIGDLDKVSPKDLDVIIVDEPRGPDASMLKIEPPKDYDFDRLRMEKHRGKHRGRNGGAFGGKRRR